ncbi:hypothetical protein GGR28_001799 [Lewinella aquimaris]|uniref:Uncharacterized protein n=1 Tax=Neolewinella aquimaris TaxID=1835722 RepID=A0A840EBK3_9BACT|nr:hypothetical protein [Neolewinella aquimaris]MBB4079179.1 hypothetical protein [Neolewinella aquimaris]
MKQHPATGSPHRPIDNNVYAYDSSRNPRHISEVDSGKKGYHCMGCSWEMIARKGAIRDHHFAHAPRNWDDKGACTYSDETYRHKLAKEILQRTKKIRVPAVYVFSDDGKKAAELCPARTVTSTTVRNEIQFYEDKDGEVKWGRGVNFNTEGVDFIIQPDVTFFNEQGEPILLIELMATHKVDAQKIAKIRRLGLDTVEVRIPKDSPESIEKVFTVTEETEWLYNHQQAEAYANGVHFPQGTDHGIPPVAEFQRAVFQAGETYTCRSFQLRDLIRGLRKCVAGERYRAVKQAATGELSNVEERRAGLGQRLKDHRSAVRDRLQRTHAAKTDRIAAETTTVSRAIEDCERRYRRLENRYRKKREELDAEQADYQSADTERVEELRGKVESVRLELRNLRTWQGEDGEPLPKAQRAVASFETKIEETERAIQAERGFAEAESVRIKQEMDGAYRAIQEGDFTKHKGIASICARADGQRRVLSDYAEAQGRLSRLKKLREILNSGMWKK